MKTINEAFEKDYRKTHMGVDMSKISNSPIVYKNEFVQKSWVNWQKRFSKSEIISA